MSAAATSVDLNADLGESFGRWRLGDDDALLDVVTSANIACGFHAGDPSTLRDTCAAAAERGVVIGAQVGYRDLAGFGRRFIDVAPRDLTADVLYQLGALDGLARVAGTQVRYLKPHGALYHAVTRDPGQAAAVVDALLAWDRPLAVLGFPGSHLLELAAAAGLGVHREGFADRAYDTSGGLVDRREQGAVLHDRHTVVERSVAMATTGRVVAADGSALVVDVDSICLHGDTTGAVELARAVRAGLEADDVVVQPFVT